MNRLVHTLATGFAAGVLIVTAAGPAHAAPQQARAPRVTLASGSVSPSVITTGETATQTITLSRKAPPGGVDISLYGDVVYNEFTGGHAYVPAGASSVRFPIRVSSYDVETVVPLYAQVPGSDVVRIAEVTVRPADPPVQAVTELRFDPDAALTGTWTTGTVVLESPAAAGGVTVEIRRNTIYGPVVIMPQWVSIPGGSTTASFAAWVDTIVEPTVIRPSAHLGSSTAVGKLVLLPDTFAVGPGWFKRGVVSDGVIGIGAAPNPDGVTITLTCDKPGVTVPESVFIPAGSRGVTFPVSVSESASVTEAGTITATWISASVTKTFFIGY